MKISSMQQLFEHQLHDVYSVEKQIITALPKMIEMANNEELRVALQKHLEMTERQKERLDTISEEVDFVKTGTECEGMKGIIAEAEKSLKEITDPAVRDAAIIAMAQRVEHYEIAAYGGAVAFAKELDLDDIADRLKETLDEEKETDEALSSLAEGGLFKAGLNEEALD